MSSSSLHPNTITTTLIPPAARFLRAYFHDIYDFAAKSGKFVSGSAGAWWGNLAGIHSLAATTAVTTGTT
ncbi:hypothetical protein G6011_04884 [Alternaria panax]|uniref:Uncharacterized protein n=1 Tax=Alternaria panax TaxID=48097 RepID=A0AAD4IHZ0_9PLEO|nr:hypothetical protein G6011_04884 [Alternaria panax]